MRVWKGLVEGLHTVFLDPENGHFRVGCIYGRNNDSARCAWTTMFCSLAATLQTCAMRQMKVWVLLPIGPRVFESEVGSTGPHSLP